MNDSCYSRPDDIKVRSTKGQRLPVYGVLAVNVGERVAAHVGYALQADEARERGRELVRQHDQRAALVEELHRVANVARERGLGQQQRRVEAKGRVALEDGLELRHHVATHGGRVAVRHALLLVRVVRVRQLLLGREREQTLDQAVVVGGVGRRDRAQRLLELVRLELRR